MIIAKISALNPLHTLNFTTQYGIQVRMGVFDLNYISIIIKNVSNILQNNWFHI